jgi:hypothetical protein
MRNVAIQKYLTQQFRNEDAFAKCKELKRKNNLPKQITLNPRPFEKNDFIICEQKALRGNDYDVSKALNLNLQTVQHILSTPEGKAAMNKYSQQFTETLHDRIQNFAPIAEKFLEELISGKIESASVALRAKYANLALARAGFGEIKNVDIVHATLSREDIERIKLRAKNAALEAGIETERFIEGEFKELRDVIEE